MCFMYSVIALHSELSAHVSQIRIIHLRILGE